ncbi:N-acetylglucosamine-6-phosphate deacetylase [Rhodobacteraceae bacterium B1Z28]|uniref:N-acetylglucosamine-6-phosphate deacetylase n=1 Tax=Ruegeria haliotis TaxID=2747601 RepID=A0ABX2PWL9_9RHOB|nr:N-acetylglucosamine-6-phosphate deacetylase [Ruegeria haliotis]NVO58617.1 N-acetylglucosamine-6-phosphate deacetylase [Ruegeria haliotis]
MSAITKAFVGAKIHDGQDLYENHALIVHDNDRLSIERLTSLPSDYPRVQLAGGTIAPGYVDLQVNGGGGVMFNDEQSVDTLRTMAQAHASIGTTAFLPTLITDTPERTRAAIKATQQAISERVDGIVGIHLEGPHLSGARKGAHDAKLIRSMSEEDMAAVLAAAETLPNVMMTVAPENTTLAQIQRMADAGIIVSLGHTDADFETCISAFDAGAKCVTHLFNAMSQMGNREPGLVGAALHHDEVYAGLIADSIHVHPAAMRIALAAKANTDRIFLVTDAMASAGSSIKSFLINDRRVLRNEGRLTLENGTLAGADLELTQAVSVMVNTVGESLSSSLARATSVPAGLLNTANGQGRLTDASQKVLYIQDDLTQFVSLPLRSAAWSTLKPKHNSQVKT